MLENIQSILREQCGLSPERPVIVGVSGGPDSLCLMSIVRRAGYHAIVAHFNHKLRPDADADANIVEQTAARLNLVSVIESGEVRAYAETTLEDTPVDITLAGSDPDGDPLEYTVVAPPMFGMLSGMAPSLSYEPLSNYFGADAFTYFVSDRTTNSAVATVSIDITPVQDLTAATLSLTRVNDGKLQLAMSGEPWQQHVIEVSEDLKVWSPLTNVISGNLTMELWDVAPGEHGQRFYRARPSSAGE